MRVIEDGNTIGWSTIVKCSGKGMGGKGCGAKLEITKDDIHTVSDGGYCEIGNQFPAITCTQCKTTTCLSDARVSVPEGIWQEVRGRNR